MKEFNNTKIIGIDHGYGNMKTANFCFPTGIMAYDNEPLFTADMLVFGGRYYLIGEGHKEFVLETIQKVARYVQEFEPVFLYLFAKQNTIGREIEIRQMKQNIEASKRRIKELDKLIERIYEDNVLGKISDDRFYRMSANYEKEQKELLTAVEHDEQQLRKTEQEKIDLKVFLEAIRECIDLKELTPTIVNTLIKRIDVHNSTKGDDGLKHVPIDISFTAVGIINIPTEKELLQAMEEMREKPLKTA